MIIISQESPLDKWAVHKKQSLEMATRMARMRSINPSRPQRMLSCGDTLTSRYCPSCGHTHVIAAKRCRDRLCPLCTWRLSIQRYHEMMDTLELLQDQIDQEHLHASMLTLTVRNVKVSDLKECLQMIQAAWKRLYQSKLWRGVIGWARCLEITYNSKAKTVHPHLHILALTEDRIDYQTADTELRMGWRSAARLRYNPQTDIREAYDTNGAVDVWRCAGEAFSYSIKPSTLLSMPDKQLETFANQIAGTRMTSYGGIIKTARAQLGFTDDEYADDNEHGDTTCQCGSPLEEMVLAWSAGGYHRISREVTA